MGPTVADIKQRLHEADEREFAVLERSLVADARKGVRDAVERARARLAAEAAERQRARWCCPPNRSSRASTTPSR